MSEIISSYQPGWVKHKNGLLMTESIFDIIKFYVWGTPCDNTSSSGKTMKEYGWGKDVWSKGDLRQYLLDYAHLQNGKTYYKGKKLDDMSRGATSIGAGKHFYNNRDANSLIFYNDGKRPDVLAILYYIRCAIAHGRFQLYTTPNGILWALEAAVKKRGSDDYSVRAQMMLSERTLVEWSKIITGGEDNLNENISKMHKRIQTEIMLLIEERIVKKQAELVGLLPYEGTIVNRQFNVLRDNKSVYYDRSNKRWKITRTTME